jgi:hypothetical protein
MGDRLAHGDLPQRHETERLFGVERVLMARAGMVEEIDTALDRRQDLLVGVDVAPTIFPADAPRR